MNHITKYHIHPRLNKSTFCNWCDVESLIKQVLAHPIHKKPHSTKRGRWWYLGKFSHVIGYRGLDSAKCKWLVVLGTQNEVITAYPVPHPKTLTFMR